MDFTVRNRGADDDLGTFPAIVDSSTGCMRAVASETKGATDHLASSVADFVKTCWVGRCRLRCDNEPSIMAVAESVKAKMLDTAVVGSAPSRIVAKREPRQIFWILCHEIRTWSGWHHIVQGSV